MRLKLPLPEVAHISKVMMSECSTTTQVDTAPFNMLILDSEQALQAHDLQMIQLLFF